MSGISRRSGRNKHRAMYLRMITQSFWHRVSRVLIASLSIAVGAATLSCLGIVAYTVPAQMTKELRSYGANLVVLPDGAESLTADQLEAADAAVGPKALGRAAYTYTNLLYNQQGLSVVGTDIADAQAIRPYWEIDGAVPTGAGQILVGESVAEDHGFDVGDQVGLTEPTVEDGAAEQLEVTGILTTGGAEDDQIFMSRETLASFTGDAGGGYSMFEYSVNADGDTLAAVADSINADGADMDAEVVRRTSSAETGIAQTLQTLIWLVSIIICLLTVISISVTLNAVVSERAREIGLKKALGALSKDILGEFMGESVFLGLLGGAVGGVVGIWIAREIAFRAFAVHIGIPWWVIPLTLVFAVVVAMLGSLVPARRISRINPVDVLGGE